jgi:hypothetical protein
MRRALSFIAIISVGLAACGSSAKSNSQPTTTTTAVTTTTVSSAGTTVPLTSNSSAATTVPPAPSTTIATVIKESAYIDSVDLAAHTITLDPMEFLTGPAATVEYHKANPSAPPGGPDNDYFIVNPTKDHVVMPLDPKAIVQLVIINGVPHTTPVAVPQAKLATYTQLTVAPFWITIERGTVTVVMEQFVP